MLARNSTEQPTSIRAVVELTANALGKEFSEVCIAAEERFGQDSRYWLDSSKIRSLGWVPKVEWDEGLTEMVAWGQKYFDQLKDVPTGYVLRG